MSGNCEIQAFSEIYSVNVNINELESTLEPSYEFIKAGLSNHPIFLMYRNNDHYNSLNLKGSVIVTKHSKNKKEPKASKHIFESKIKAVDKNVNFAGEKQTLTQKIFYFLSSNIDSQSLILMNPLIIIFILKEFINSHIIKERTKKEHSEAKLTMVKSIRLRQLKLIKTCKETF